MNPLRRALAEALSLKHPVLPADQVALARLLALAWLLTGHVSWAPAVRLPWIRIADAAAGSAWPLLVIALSLVSAFVTLFSPAVRSGALGLALSILLGLASARAAFAYNRLFVACLLLLIAASAGRPLARWQVAVLYLGAAADKVRTPDWRSGQMLQSLVVELARFGRLWGPGGHVGAPNPVPGWLGSLPLWVFVAASAGVIVLEVTLAIGFAGGWWWAALPNVGFQVALVLLTGGTFGVFFHACLACTVLLVPPTAGISARPFRLDWRGRQWRGVRATALAALVFWPGVLALMAVLCLPWFSPALVAGFVVAIAAGLSLPSPSATEAQTG